MGSYSDQQYETAVYNLDVIISVGYRVKSQRGTQFRVWANKVLKEYLIKGYAINQQVKIEQLEDLKNTVHLLSNVIEHKQLTLDEANGLLRVITDYTYGLDTLDKYDFQQLEVVSTTPSREFRATYEEAMGAIHLLQEKFGSSDLFGNEKRPIVQKFYQYHLSDLWWRRSLSEYRRESIHAFLPRREEPFVQ